VGRGYASKVRRVVVMPAFRKTLSEILSPLDPEGMGEVEPLCGREPAGEIPTPSTARGRDPVLTPGTKLGAYEITCALGAGAMGEVEPLCGRERSGSPQAESRGERGIQC
jgi:hypothetical protein